MYIKGLLLSLVIILTLTSVRFLENYSKLEMDYKVCLVEKTKMETDPSLANLELKDTIKELELTNEDQRFIIIKQNKIILDQNDELASCGK